jgi:hypothetical protein
VYVRVPPRPAWGQFWKCTRNGIGNLSLRLVAIPESNPPSVWPYHARPAKWPARTPLAGTGNGQRLHARVT